MVYSLDHAKARQALLLAKENLRKETGNFSGSNTGC